MNDVTRIERTREGVIQMNPPAGSFSSDGIQKFASNYAPGGRLISAGGSTIQARAFTFAMAQC